MKIEKFVKHCERAQNAGGDTSYPLVVGVCALAFFMMGVVSMPGWFTAIDGHDHLRSPVLVAIGFTWVGVCAFLWLGLLVTGLFEVRSHHFIQRLRDRPDLRKVHHDECAPEIRKREEAERRKRLVTF